MSFNIKAAIQYIPLGIFLGILVALASVVSAFSPPTQSPPNGNVSAPLNTGPNAQEKIGGLIINSGGAEVGLIVDQGKVGIGTSTPQSALDIRGDVNVGSSESPVVAINRYQIGDVQAVNAIALRGSDIYVVGYYEQYVPDITEQYWQINRFSDRGATLDITASTAMNRSRWAEAQDIAVGTDGLYITGFTLTGFGSGGGHLVKTNFDLGTLWSVTVDGIFNVAVGDSYVYTTEQRGSSIVVVKRNFSNGAEVAISQPLGTVAEISVRDIAAGNGYVYVAGKADNNKGYLWEVKESDMVLRVAIGGAVGSESLDTLLAITFVDGNWYLVDGIKTAKLSGGGLGSFQLDAMNSEVSGKEIAVVDNSVYTIDTIDVFGWGVQELSASTLASVGRTVPLQVSKGYLMKDIAASQDYIYVAFEEDRSGSDARNLIGLEKFDPEIQSSSLNIGGPLLQYGSLFSDIAEDYPVADTAQAGDVVVFSSRQPGAVEKSSISYQKSLAGVLSTNPAHRLAAGTKDGKPLALAGRVPVKVSTENGSVAVGDFLTSSSTPGVAMKATQVGRVFGVALENFSQDGIGMIRVFVNLSWYPGK